MDLCRKRPRCLFLFAGSGGQGPGAGRHEAMGMRHEARGKSETEARRKE